MSALRRGLLGVLLCAAVTACGTVAAAGTPKLPSRILPQSIDGYTVHEEVSARTQFDVSRTQVAEGRLFTMRANGAVYAALQVATLRADLDTTDVDVQQDIRKQIGSGGFRYYRVAGQWIGDQQRPDVHLFVWFPDASPGVFEVLTVSNQLSDPVSFVGSLIGFQEGR
ncbi:MAG TPA: hypothetical protein VFC09_14105 [Candidatus Dormibacteraeota bacterium]|nr:hypothetical protein [Candidatus Dormibacteraeota bacterium]